MQPAAIDKGFDVLVDIELTTQDKRTVQRFEAALITNALMTLPGLARLQSRFPMKTLKNATPPIG